MTDFNPLTGAILGSAQVQNQLGLQKQRQLRRAQTLRKDSAPTEDQFEQQVESPQELTAIHDQHDQKEQSQGRQNQPRRQKSDAEEERSAPHIDMTA
jgi:hypothetical protein